MACTVPLQVPLLAALATLSVPTLSLPRPHGSGWVPSGGWSTPSFGSVSQWGGTPQFSSGWSDYNVGVDPWATQKAKYKANPAAWWAASASGPTAAGAAISGHHPRTVASGVRVHHTAPANLVTAPGAWYEQHHTQPPQQRPQYHQHQEPQYQSHQHTGPSQPHPHTTAVIYPPQQQHVYQGDQQDLYYEQPQVVRKSPSYASLYPWAEKPTYGVHVPTHSYPSHHTSYTGWTRIPVVDQNVGSEWVAWVPEEFGDFVIVRKDKAPKKKKKIEEEEDEDEPEEKPKPKKKISKTIVEEEEEPADEEPKPKKKTKTIVEESVMPDSKKTTKTTVMEEVPDDTKKTTKTVVMTEEKQGAATAPEAVTVVAPITSPSPSSSATSTSS